MNFDRKLSKILCAVDFSEESLKAVEFAYSIIVPRNDSTLYLLNVVKPVYAPIGDGSGAAEILVEENDQMLREAREKIESLAREIRSNGFDKVHGIVRSGEPVVAILDTVNEFKIDLVVMGNKKHGFKKGILLGSVSERVSANSPVSVLIVR
ncbi:MAG: universal stress protein [Candidatus Thermoplasmatota archaeon]|nr:universal stress protein [Candidatus Thermoplasmatota archaeon]